MDECRDRNYIKANEHYLLLAIGNAAWPIGVTMVGIHERSGREKIFSQKQAHVLNDEKQRKYIQGVKRLMSYSSNKVCDLFVTCRHGSLLLWVGLVVILCRRCCVVCCCRIFFLFSARGCG